MEHSRTCFTQTMSQKLHVNAFGRVAFFGSSENHYITSIMNYWSFEWLPLHSKMHVARKCSLAVRIYASRFDSKKRSVSSNVLFFTMVRCIYAIWIKFSPNRGDLQTFGIFEKFSSKWRLLSRSEIRVSME